MSADPGPRRRVQDALGRSLDFVFPPRRLVSLVPSHTETLFELGAGDRVTGVTKYCVHPAAEVATRVKVGGTKTLDEEAVTRLDPDLVLAEEEENTEAMVTALARSFPVYVTRIRTVADAIRTVRSFGDLVGCPARGVELATSLETGLARVAGRVRGRVAYLIWRKPWMAAGRDTFLDAVLTHLGFENAIEDDRYPALDLEQLAALDPDHVLLSSEPFPFGPKHVTEVKARLPRARVHLVDGEMFSWHGTRLLRLPDYMEKILPEIETA